jgi:Alpha/beta hydrolase domain
MMRRLLWGVVCALLLFAGGSPAVSAEGASPAATGPTVTGPITGGGSVPIVFSGQPADRLVGRETFDLADVGYAQSEFFLEGTATAYAPTPGSTLTRDGRWTVEPSSSAPYTSRVVVNRPVDRRDFNGVVVVEWLNVSGGADASPDWMHTHVELIRRGYAWVGVSAQAVGVNGLKGVPPQGDPVRYAALSHPGDSYSYDVFSQAGQAVRDQAGVLLAGLRPKRLLAVGESQPAGRLVTYIDGVHPLAQVYDGFLVHSRSAGGAPLSQPPLPTVPTATPTLLRDDLDVPVLVFTTETDVGSLQARQADSPRYRLWEAAGTAHFDEYGLITGATDTGEQASVARWFDTLRHPTSQPSPQFTCAVPINSGPQTFVLRSALAHLDRWVARGTPPPRAPRLETSSLAPVQYVLDANGHVRGGIRTPAVDAPVATLSGLGQTGSQFCFLFGTTVPFTDEQLAALYGNHGRFVAAWTRATLSATLAGYLRPEDAVNLLVAGARSDILR